MNPASKVALSPLAALYRGVMRGRRALYERGLLRVHNVGVPVISVGNITTGGTGKTPLVEWLARELAGRGRKVCILTRGYGRRNPGQRVVVSNRSEILCGVEDAGDEALLLAERLKGLAAVISDANRVSAARWAMDNLRADVLVLDDGFQHLRIARALNIATVDAANPWGNPPRSILRESPRALSRADCIVITRSGDLDHPEHLRREIQRLSNERPVFRSRMKTGGLQPLQSSARDEPLFSGAPVGAFCAIGNPESFFEHLRQDGHSLRHTRAFRDHHVYSQRDIDQLLSDATARGAQVLITTAKDEVKLRALRFTLPCYVSRITIEIEDAEELRKLISAALSVG